MADTLVVVANSVTARLLAADKPTGPLEERETLMHPEARMHERDLVSDLPGRAFDSAGQGRHAMENEVSPKEHEAITFARQLAERLDKARTQGEAGAIVLVAAPRFLGHLRSALSDETRRLVKTELDLDLVRERPEAIRARLPERL